MQSVKVGEAQISVETKGCVGCGTEYSTGWSPAQTVPVQIGKRRLEVTVSICEECQAKNLPLLKDARA